MLLLPLDGIPVKRFKSYGVVFGADRTHASLDFAARHTFDESERALDVATVQPFRELCGHLVKQVVE